MHVTQRENHPLFWECDREHDLSVLMLLNWGHYQHYGEETPNDVANLDKDKILQRAYHLEEQKQTL